MGRVGGARSRGATRGAWRGALVGAALLAAGWLAAAPARADGPQPNAPWPQQKRDGPRSGVAGVNGPANPTQVWRLDTGSPIVSGPVVASDGMIYVGTENFRIWAVRPAGTLRWNYVLHAASAGAGAPTYPVVNNRGHIVFGQQNGYVVGLDTDGNEKWVFDTRNAPYGSSDPQAVRGAPGVAANWGTMYIGTDGGNLYLLDDGAFEGVRRANDAIRAGAAVTPDGTIVWASIGKTLYGGEAQGGDKWRVGLDGAVVATLAVGQDSTIYAATDAGTVFAVTSSGQQKWRTAPGAGKPIHASPTVAPDGTVYVGTDEGRLFALDPGSGSVKWSFGTGGPITAAPTVGANGVIYLGSNDGKLSVLTPGGRALAQVQLDAAIDSASPALGTDGTLYVGTRGGALYAFKEGAPLPAPAPTSGPAPPASTGIAALPGFTFIRCNSGKVYTLNGDGTIGSYVTDPKVIGSAPILQASADVPGGFIDAVCGPGR